MPLVIVVTLLTFVLNSLAPGDMAMTILGADGTREQYEALRTELGLDRPLLLQYLSWLGQAAQGDLGVSHFTKESVTSLLNPRLGVSVSIMVGVLVVCLSVGLSLGVASALHGGWVGRAIETRSTVTVEDIRSRLAQRGSDRLARNYVRLGLGVGDRVASLMPAGLLDGLSRDEVLDLLARPGCAAQEFQAGRHAGVVREAADGDHPPQLVPTVEVGQVFDHAGQGDAVQGIARLLDHARLTPP